MHLKKSLSLLALIASQPLAAIADEAGTLYTQVGVNGVGLGYAASVSKDWAARAQYNTFKQSFSGNVGDFGSGSSLTVDIKLDSFQLVGDYYPGEGGFRFTGGVVFNNNKITASGTGQVNGKAATAINGEVKLSDDGIAPYIGLGYSTRPKDAKGLGFNFDLGAMFQNPKATLTATGGTVTAADIAAQRTKVQEAVDVLKVMPVIGIGLSYSF